uniref:Uncharacterized protein n=1 Tax=Ditylenchus dipsaci TaxID=166011 RepID=A0A915E2B0_9BILA
MLAYALLLLRKIASELLYDQNSGFISPVRTSKSVHSSVGKRHSSATSIMTSSKWIAIDAEQEFKSGGNPKAPLMDVYLQWIVDAWKSLPDAAIANEDNRIHCFKEHGPIPQGQFELLAARSSVRQAAGAEEKNKEEDEEMARPATNLFILKTIILILRSQTSSSSTSSPTRVDAPRVSSFQSNLVSSSRARLYLSARVTNSIPSLSQGSSSVP